VNQPQNLNAELLPVLDKLIERFEYELVEFKEAGNDYDKNKIGQYFSAISNEANLKGQQYGWLIFGVRNKDKVITGSDYRNTLGLDKLKQEISNNTTGRITFIDIFEVYPIIDCEKRRVIMFKIPAAVTAIPSGWNNQYFGRNGESLVPLTLEELDRIRNQKSVDWSKQTVEDATIKHLETYLKEFHDHSYKSDFLFYTIVLIIERLFDIKSGMEVSFAGGVSIVIIPILTAIMDTYLLSVSRNELLNITIVCGLFVINIIFFYFYKGEIYRNKLEYEKRLLENQNSAYEEQISIIQESEESMRKLRHDYKNHFYSIHTILEEIDNEDIKEYLDNMNKFINRSETYVITGNSKLDSMLNYKINAIKNMGVTTEIDLQIPRDIEISLFDFTVIFGNLFDNVIEALSHIENGFFMLKGRYEKGTIYFVLKIALMGKYLSKMEF